MHLFTSSLVNPDYPDNFDKITSTAESVRINIHYLVVSTTYNRKNPQLLPVNQGSQLSGCIYQYYVLVLTTQIRINFQLGDKKNLWNQKHEGGWMHLSYQQKLNIHHAVQKVKPDLRSEQEQL